MRQVAVGVLVAISVLFASQAHAVPTEGIDVAGVWGAEKGCSDGNFNYVRDNGDLFQVVDDNGKIYRSRVRVTIEGDRLHVIDDEKMFTYRIIGVDRMEFVGFTNLDNGLSARTKPKVWHRCS